MTDPNQVIATRLISLDAHAPESVELYMPVKRAGENEEFRCGYRILGLGDDRMKYASGVDSMQALYLALQRIGIDLYTSQPGKSGRLRWLDQRDLGFPVPSSMSDLAPGEQQQS
jgi:hypothetical protein